MAMWEGQYSSRGADWWRTSVFFKLTSNRVRKNGQPLQSRKLSAAGLFWWGRRGQRRQRRGDHEIAAQVFLRGHAASWG